jgi:predicted RNase H-like HicB family nuclease
MGTSCLRGEVELMLVYIRGVGAKSAKYRGGDVCEGEGGGAIRHQAKIAKGKKMESRYRILVVVGKGPRNYSAYAPEVSGCVATGKTLEETLRLMTEALQMHLEGMIEDGDELPLSADPEDTAHFLDIEVGASAPVLHQAG